MEQYVFLSFLLVIFSRLAYIQISTSNCVANDSRLWPNGTLCYRFHKDFTKNQIALFHECFTWINSTTCIRFVPAAENQTNCVYITGDNTGCHAQVGFLNRSQKVNIPFNKPGEGCMRTGQICHEIAHALGFFHEHTRCDRDSRIYVVEENISKGAKQYFTKKCNTRTVTPYDTCSILHYRPFIHTNNGEPTIIACNNETIGQRQCLSPLDVMKFNIMYKCKRTGIISPYICPNCETNPRVPPINTNPKCLTNAATLTTSTTPKPQMRPTTKKTSQKKNTKPQKKKKPNKKNKAKKKKTPIKKTGPNKKTHPTKKKAKPTKKPKKRLNN